MRRLAELVESSTARAHEFCRVTRDNTEGDIRRWINTGFRWAWIAGYLAGRLDIDESAHLGDLTPNPFQRRSLEEESGQDPNEILRGVL